MKQLVATGSLGLLLLLSACGSLPSMQGTVDTNVSAEEVQAVSNDTKAEAKKSKEDCNHEVDAYAYFMADGTTAHFKGEGNEFATLTIRTNYLEENHVALYEDNGGTRVLRVYRLSEERIELVKEEAEFYDDYNPTLEELQALEPISTYLEFPLKKGDIIDGRTIVDTQATVQTPYKTFKRAVVFESESEGGGLNRSYFVEGFGEVKREFILEEGEDTFTVTSSLEKIE